MARKAAWEDAADSDLGPYGKSSGTRWGRVLLGIVLVASATFVAAYYLPLYRAQQKLSAQYRDLNQRSFGLTDAASKFQADLKGVTLERDQLRADRDRRESAKQAERQQMEALRADLSSKLDKFVKKGWVSLSVSGGSLWIALDDTLLFVPQQLDLNPGARAPLCELAKSLGKLSLRVNGEVAEGATIPAGLAASFRDPWALSAARAATVAQSLEDNCAVPAAQLSATGRGKHDPFAAQFAGGKVPAERVVLEFSQP